MSPTLGAHPAVGLLSALKTQTQVALPLLPVETGPLNRPQPDLPRQRLPPCAILSSAQGPPPSGPVGLAPVDGLASAVPMWMELDCLEAYLFLYRTVGSLTFQITPFLSWALRITQDS